MLSKSRAVVTRSLRRRAYFSRKVVGCRSTRLFIAAPGVGETALSLRASRKCSIDFDAVTSVLRLSILMNFDEARKVGDAGLDESPRRGFTAPVLSRGIDALLYLSLYGGSLLYGKLILGVSRPRSVSLVRLPRGHPGAWSVHRGTTDRREDKKWNKSNTVNITVGVVEYKSH